MTKKLTFLLLAVMFMAPFTVVAQTKVLRNHVDRNVIKTKPLFDRGGLIETNILTEDFSKFTAGSEASPDNVRLDDAETYEINDEYFNTSGWSGLEVYQAGGCAYIGFSQEYGEPGFISTPLLNTKGAIYIKCRMRSENPEGDIVGYNIVDETWNAIDANVDFIEVTNEWTDVSWFTSLGDENTYIYIFPYSSNVFVDDIEIVKCSMPTPVLLDETDITENAFTANWEAVDDVDAYIFKLYTDHTATSEETFFYTNTDFRNVVSEGTLSTPETNENWHTIINNWNIYMPALINEAIGITGRYSYMEFFGTISSPVFDFSSDNGNVNISFKAYGNVNDEFEINLITPKYGYYDVAYSKKIKIEKEGWNDYSLVLTNGMEESYIEISYFGSGDIFFDDLKLYQTISEGETKTLTLEHTETQDTYYRAKIEDKYLNDVIYYQVAASKYVYSQDSEDVIGYIDSDFTEVRHITFNDEATADETINIGEGELESNYAPISNYGTSSFSVSQQIYTKDEINKDDCTITSISFHNKKGNSNTRNITVFMSNTSQDSYRDNHDWVYVEESQIVFSGDFTFGAQEEWATIELQNPFAYNGNHIALTIYDASGEGLGYGGSHDTFYATATDTLRGLYRTASSKINVYSIDEVYGYELKTSVYSTPANQYYVNNIKFKTGEFTIESPSVPQNLSANVIDKNSISLSWTSAQNATSYNVYRGTEKLANVTTTSYLVEGLEADTEYCFTITALNNDIESEKSAEACEKTLSGVGIAELASALNIYPNPAKDILYIETELNVEEVAIYDIYGRQCQLSAIGSQQSAIDVTNLNNGVYFVKVVTSDSKVVKRFVKN